MFSNKNEINLIGYKASISRLKKLKGQYYNPRAFLERSTDPSSEAMKMGIAIEDFLQRGEQFVKDKFTFVDVEMPTSKVVKEVIEQLAKTGWNDINIVKTARAYGYGGKTYKDPKILTNIKKFKSYYDHLILPPDDLDKFLPSSKWNIIYDSAQGLLNGDETKKYFKLKKDEEKISQVHIVFNYLGVQCQGYLDDVIINHKEKTITIIDIKTGTLSFPVALNQFDYDLQGAFYYVGMPLSEWYKEYEGYTIKRPIFIHSKLTSPQYPTAWEMTEEVLERAINGSEECFDCSGKYIEGKEGLAQLITKYKHHLANGFTKPYGFTLPRPIKTV